jgi:hypothetical protein
VNKETRTAVKPLPWVAARNTLEFLIMGKYYLLAGYLIAQEKNRFQQ